MPPSPQKCTCTRVCAPMQRCRNFFAMKTIANCLESCANIMQAVVFAARLAAVSTKSVAWCCSLTKTFQIHASSWRSRHCGVAQASFDHARWCRPHPVCLWFALEAWPRSSPIKNFYFCHFSRVFRFFLPYLILSIQPHSFESPQGDLFDFPKKGNCLEFSHFFITRTNVFHTVFDSVYLAAFGWMATRWFLGFSENKFNFGKTKNPFPSPPKHNTLRLFGHFPREIAHVLAPKQGPRTHKGSERTLPECTLPSVSLFESLGAKRDLFQTLNILTSDPREIQDLVRNILRNSI